MNPIKATLYVKGEFGGAPIKREINLLESGIDDYAQFKDRTWIKYTIGRKKSVYRTQQGFNPFFVVVEGWNQPNNPDGFITTKEENGFITQESQYLSHDNRYYTDFNTWFNQQNFKILVDARFIK